MRLSWYWLEVQVLGLEQAQVWLSLVQHMLTQNQLPQVPHQPVVDSLMQFALARL